MNAVLLSIKPKYCELIASGAKTIEIRKTEPKLRTPFKCYVYLTKDKHTDVVFKNHKAYLFQKLAERVKASLTESYVGNGYVIGEFICDYISKLPLIEDIVYCSEYKKACLSVNKIKEYAKGKQLYGWHISNLIIYNKPKELSEFYKSFLPFEDGIRVKRPPQSWYYVEEL